MINTSVATPPQRSTASGDDSRAERYEALQVIWRESRDKRFRACSRVPRKGAEAPIAGGKATNIGVKLTTHTDGKKSAGFTGLHVCGSVWTCPVCSAKIAGVRSPEIAKAMQHWNSIGGRLVFMTLTVRHNRRQSLKTVWDAVSHASKRVTSDRAWIREQENHGMDVERVITKGHRAGEIVTESRIPYVRAVEVTQGDNGWHVHTHWILFVSGSTTAAQAAALGDSIYGRWANGCVAMGLTSPAPEHGVDIRMVLGDDFTDLGKYFAKQVYNGRRDVSGAASEVVAGGFKKARKGNRTPFQILGDIVANGDEADLKLWHVWEKYSKGRRQLSWSRGLRDLVGLNDELTDEEAAAKELGGELVMSITWSEFKSIAWMQADFKTAVEQHKGPYTFDGVRARMDRIRADRLKRSA